MTKGDHRLRLGQFFTPPALAGALLDRLLARLPLTASARSRWAVVDPAAGEGALLQAAVQAGFPAERMLGLELDGEVAARGFATRQADGYAPESLERLLAFQPQAEGLLVLGNPPFNGRSALLDEPQRHAEVTARLLDWVPGPVPHSGFRDDFVLFLGLGHALLSRRAGPCALGFILPSALLTARDHGGLRRGLEAAFDVEVVELGAGRFEGARVETCFVLLLPRAAGAAPRLDHASSPESVARPLVPGGGTWRPTLDLGLLEADALPLTDVLQRWFTPHKTGFDALFVDGDRVQLEARLDDLPRLDPAAFAARHGEPFAAPRAVAKLERIRAWLQAHPEVRLTAQVVPWLACNPGEGRFAPAPHQWQWACFEPRIGALFHHAFHGRVGRFEPHLQKPQLLFNTHEARLWSQVVEREAHLHLFQHARFAPLLLPERCWLSRDSRLDRQDEGPLVLNLTAAGRAWAAALRDPADLFHLITGLIWSAPIQRLFAPHAGTLRPVPIPAFDAALVPVAQRLADGSRALAREESGPGQADLFSMATIEAAALQLYGRSAGGIAALKALLEATQLPTAAARH